MTVSQPSSFSKIRPLGPWLLANGIFSITSGSLIVILARLLPTFLGVGGATLYVVLGLGLVVYGIRLWVLSRRDVSPFEGWAIVLGDVLWVLGSAALLAAGVFTPRGRWVVAAVAALIGVFALGQGGALVRRPPRSQEAGPPPLLVLMIGSLLGWFGASGVPLSAQSGDPASSDVGPREAVAAEMPAREVLRVLPETSPPTVDRMLEALEEAYASMDVEHFIAFYADDFEQVDVPRRVRVTGKEAWRAQTERINGVHESMGREHHGRVVVGDWVVVELEWFGVVHGEAVGRPGELVRYSYDGLGLLELNADGRIRRQILYGDVTSLEDQLGVSLSGGP